MNDYINVVDDARKFLSSGYLQKECPSAGHVFLKNSSALAEFREAKRLGRRALDTVNGHSLIDLLSDVSDTYNLGM